MDMRCKVTVARKNTTESVSLRRFRGDRGVYVVYRDQCRIKVGAIDAAALGPLKK